jgi:hypothetical protein
MIVRAGSRYGGKNMEWKNTLYIILGKGDGNQERYNKIIYK